MSWNLMYSEECRLRSYWATIKEGKGLKKILGVFELTILGIGAIIGTGIFVLTGGAAADYAGPACAFEALCYAQTWRNFRIANRLGLNIGILCSSSSFNWLVWLYSKYTKHTSIHLLKALITAFVIVSLSVIILRKSRPDLQRPFKVPFVPVVPILAVVFCLFLILQLSTFTKIAFLIRISIGFIVYVFYGYKHSSLNEEKIKS